MDYTLRQKGQPEERQQISSVAQLHEIIMSDYQLPISLEDCQRICQSLPTLQHL